MKSRQNKIIKTPEKTLIGITMGDVYPKAKIRM